VPNTVDTSDTNGDLPDLTLGQKLLLKLPDLRRTPAPKPAPKEVPKSAPKAASKPRGRPVLETPEPDSDETVDDEAVGEPSDTVVTADESEKTTASKGRPAKRAGTSKQPAPSPYDKLSTKELTDLYKQLDSRDRLIATIAAPLGAAIAIVETVSSLHHDPALHHKGYVPHSTIIDLCIVAIVICALALVVARMRRRSLTAFALMFVGIALNPLSLGLPFVIFGGYLVFKMLKVQKVLTARGVARPGGRRREAMRAGTAATRKTADEKAKNKSPSSGPRPTPSKRYTPPKPPPKRPAKPIAEATEKEKRPNWLERATERSEQRAASKAEGSDSG
jgi:hypothetical protein